MILNKERETVWEHTCGSSTCPICGARLYEKKPEDKIWHWAHYPKERKDCPGGAPETKWHLAMKFAYLSFPNWDIEVPLENDFGNYRIDAMNKKTGDCREFVHSLCDSYYEKLNMLVVEEIKYRWIFDGHEFASKRQKVVAKDGIRSLLKPLATEYCIDLGGIVHFENKFWNHWKYNVWYPNTDSKCQIVIDRFNEALKKKFTEQIK